MKIISIPLKKSEIKNLKAGDEVLLNGIIYTARDQAHKRLVKDLGKGEGKEIPFNIKGAVIYYCGPTARPKGNVIGSCGPTTSSRMDEFTPLLIKKGLTGMIGKGRRSKEIISAIKKHKAVYFRASAGCGALLSQYVISNRVVAFEDLGPEAICRLEVKNFPLMVGIDAKGKDIYSAGKAWSFTKPKHEVF